jgi:hypothetical protein
MDAQYLNAPKEFNLDVICLQTSVRRIGDLNVGSHYLRDLSLHVLPDDIEEIPDFRPRA